MQTIKVEKNESLQREQFQARLAFLLLLKKLQLLQYLAVNYAIFETCLNVIARLQLDRYITTYVQLKKWLMNYFPKFVENL